MGSKDILKLIKDKQAEFVDLRFTDPKGKLQHLTMDSTIVDQDMLETIRLIFRLCWPYQSLQRACRVNDHR